MARSITSRLIAFSWSCPQNWANHLDSTSISNGNNDGYLSPRQDTQRGTCRRLLETSLPSVVRSFAYPYSRAEIASDNTDARDWGSREADGGTVSVKTKYLLLKSRFQWDLWQSQPTWTESEINMHTNVCVHLYSSIYLPYSTNICSNWIKYGPCPQGTYKSNPEKDLRRHPCPARQCKVRLQQHTDYRRV